MNPFMGSNEFNMKQLFLTILSLFCIITSVFADGTKQFMPNANTEADPQPKGQCYLALGSREGGSGPSRDFARYDRNGTSCEDADRLYIRIADHTKEVICLGIGGVLYNEGTLALEEGKFKDPVTHKEIKYRLKQCAADDPAISTTVDNGLSPDDPDPIIYKNPSDDPATYAMGYPLPTSGNAGYISTYSKAYYGPNIVTSVGSKGYEPIIYTVPRDGLYYIEFYIGHDRGSTDHKPIDFKLFDISVVKDTVIDNVAQKVQMDGRIYSKSWGLTTKGNGSNGEEAWSTFYTFSNDHYTTKVYLAGVMPWRFVFCCNSFGAINTSTMEENRRSYPQPDGNTVKNYIPEYKIFTTAPDTIFYGTAAEPNLPSTLSFAGDAMTCEDLIFVMQLLNREDATIELYLNSPEGNTKTLIDVLKSSKAEERGYHYPWKDKPQITEAGIYDYIPITSQEEICERKYKLSLFDQRYTINNTTGTPYNVGDTIETDYPGANATIHWKESLGSAKNPILISTAEQLKALATAVNEGTDFSYTLDLLCKDNNTTYSRTFTIPNTNGFKDVNFYIVAKTGNIVLGSDWEGIGTLEHPFKGIMRNGKYIPDPIKGTDATIDDQNTITFNGAGKPLFNYCEDATLDNIHVSGNITLDKDNYTQTTTWGGFGGICSVAKNSKFYYCSNTINLKKDSKTTPGITLYTGGIVGYADGCTLDSCKNYGEIDPKFNLCYEGGICGYITNSSKINFCYNVGLINSEYIPGGIVGYALGDNTISNCKNINSIASEGFAGGGIIGYADDDGIEITDCYNSGTITATTTTGGILGYINGVPTNIQFCYNTGETVIKKTNEPVTPGYAIVDEEDNYYGDYITNCLSTGTPAIYITNSFETDDIADFPSKSEIVSALGSDHFELNEAGTEIIHKKTKCCGSTWRMEEAGRLFKSDNTFTLLGMANSITEIA